MTTPAQARYRQEWGREFWAAVDAALGAGARTVLDVGGGRTPTIPPGRRPAGATYVGLDVSAAELRAAPPGSYDEEIAADAAEPVAGLAGRFELIVSWQVLEHVADLPRVAAVLRGYAAPGGVLVAHLSGRWAAYAVANRLLPAVAGRHVVARLRGRPPEAVFPARYDHCDAPGLRRAFAGWAGLDVLPLWRGADYFDRVPPVRRAYLRYEDWAVRRGLERLATNYLVVARA